MKIKNIMTGWSENVVHATVECSKCKLNLEGNENYCPRCGRELERINTEISKEKLVSYLNGGEEKMDILDRIDKKMFGETSGKQKEENKETK